MPTDNDTPDNPVLNPPEPEKTELHDPAKSEDGGEQEYATCTDGDLPDPYRGQGGTYVIDSRGKRVKTS